MSLQSELVTQAIGIGPILRGEPRFGVEQQAAAETLPKRLRAMLLRFMGGAKTEHGEMPPFDLADVGLLLRGTGEGRLSALHALLNNPGLADEVAADVTRIVDYMQKALEQRVTKTVVKETTLPPEPFEMGRLRRKWAVAVDPAIVVRDLLSGSVDPGMVAALAAMWPAIFGLLVTGSQETGAGLVDEAIIAMKAKRHDKFDLPYDRNNDLKVLLQVPPMNLALASDYGRVANVPPPPEAPQGKPSSPKPKAVKLENSEALPGQKSA